MIHFEKYQLSNGLTVIAEQDKSTTLAAVNILYKVGSKNESPERTGFAHLFEHLMFAGSYHAPDYDNWVQNAGGENNASTNNDFTNYYTVLPHQNLETVLWLEADRMINLSISQKALKIQQNVILEEYNEVCLNRPYGDSWHHLSNLAYKVHPYRWPTIGMDIQHVAMARLEEVKSFYRKYYQPSNAILSVSSPYPTEYIFEKAEKFFSFINKPKFSLQAYQKLDNEAPQMEARQETIRGDVPGPLLLMAFHMPGRMDPDYFVCDIITDLLANGKSSRLYSNLVKKDKLMSSADAYITGTVDPGLIIFEGRPMPDIDLDQCSCALWNEIEILKNNRVSETELQKVKNRIVSSLIMSDMSILNKAISLSYFEFLGALDTINEQEDLYQAVTPEMIQEIARKYLKDVNECRLNYLVNEASLSVRA